jgi:hypothetical protein
MLYSAVMYSYPLTPCTLYRQVCMLQRRLRTVCRHVKPLPGRYSEIFHSMHESLAEVL